MSEDPKRAALEESLNTYLSLIDEAKALIGGQEAPADQNYDLSEVLDLLAPPPLDLQDMSTASLKVLEAMVASCTKCRLANGRTNTVFGEGSVPARLMVIGEGPGADEDATGKPFVGKAGEYLDTWLNAIHLGRGRGVYLANIVKCRPPNNRDPQNDERDACLPYLKRQIQLIKPQMILLLGRTAAQTLLATEDGVGKLRGRFHRVEEIPAVVTYHPAAVLRNLELKRPVWEDLKRVATYLGIDYGKR